MIYLFSSRIIRCSVFLVTFHLSALTVFSAVFTVTSNSDAGSGTFREALTLAASNGDVNQDFIYFNLPDHSETGRTIILMSQLPDVSSNLTIDASAQPGSVFGVSTARVKLVTAFTFHNTFYGLRLFGIHDVAIYSLYISNITPLPQTADDSYWQGISIKDCKNIRIGAAGKGNVICGFLYDIGINVREPREQTLYYSENISIKGSFISVEPDGVTLSSIFSRTLEFNMVYGQVDIGGTIAEGNILSNGLSIFPITSVVTNPADTRFRPATVIKVSYNNIGVDYSGTQGFSGSTGLLAGTTIANDQNTAIIEDNIISTQTANGIRISNIGGMVSVKRNFIGTDRVRTKRLPIGGTGIFVDRSTRVLIGSSDPADANNIAYCKPVDIRPYSSASVNKNSFFCTVDPYPMIFAGVGTITAPTVQILDITAAGISGTATPYSSIELFYSDICGTCSPETYFGSVMADQAGSWQYLGPISGTVIASATYGNATSEFTYAHIDVSKVIVEQVCSNTGSIRGAVPANATNIMWVDENGNVVGTDPDLLNVPVGKYKLQASNGNCNAETIYYELQQSFVINTGNVVSSDATCGNTNGFVRGLTVINNTTPQTIYSWKDEDGTEVARTADLNNVKAGNYTLTVSDGTGCEKILNYTISDQAETIPLPDVNDLNICRPGTALLAVKNTSDQYGYRLYSDADSDLPIGQEVSGKFGITVEQDRSFFISQYHGTCESPKKEIRIQIGKTSLDAPNTFTPNGDGYNDIWVIRGIENFQRVSIQLYDRYGTKVFEVSNYQNTFDGTNKGNPLAAGTYFYIINTETGCDPVSGSLTILR